MEFNKKFNLGYYKSMFGFLSVLGLLVIGCTLGIISIYFHNKIIFYSFVTSIFIAMIYDIVVQYPKIMPYYGYLLHHIITMIMVIIAMCYITILVPLNFGLVSYMLLGAIFRRVRNIILFVFPDKSILYKLNNSLMTFFDFSDLLAISIFWHFIFSWPPLMQLTYFALVIIRLYIWSNPDFTDTPLRE
jgi:hypothetical protein